MYPWQNPDKEKWSLNYHNRKKGKIMAVWHGIKIHFKNMFFIMVSKNVKCTQSVTKEQNLTGIFPKQYLSAAYWLLVLMNVSLASLLPLWKHTELTGKHECAWIPSRSSRLLNPTLLTFAFKENSTDSKDVKCQMFPHPHTSELGHFLKYCTPQRNVPEHSVSA